MKQQEDESSPSDNNPSETEIEQQEMLYLPDEEFKTLLIKMISDLKGTVQALDKKVSNLEEKVSNLEEKCSREIETLKNNQMGGSGNSGSKRMNKFTALKDDDSGDHDQNKENSTQKDGKKEKMEEDRSQSSSKRKATVPGPAEHPLQYNYTFWYSRRARGCPVSPQSYEKSIKQIGTFASVEQFWRFYSHMVRPGQLKGNSDFHLFKEGIKPMWEDDANKNGGKWIIRLQKGLASHCWENLILAMLGEQFIVGEEICGAAVSVRFQEDIISIWNKTASDQATRAQIRNTLQRVLNLPPNTIMKYKTHTDSLVAWEEFRDQMNSSRC